MYIQLSGVDDPYRAAGVSKEGIGVTPPYSNSLSDAVSLLKDKIVCACISIDSVLKKRKQVTSTNGVCVL